MSRKLIAVVVSSAFLLTGLPAVAAGPATPPPASVPQTAAPAKNQPPLPAGPARIKSAQGLGDDDLGPGVIIGAIAVATGLLFLMMFSDDDDTSSSTGT